MSSVLTPEGTSTSQSIVGKKVAAINPTPTGAPNLGCNEGLVTLFR